MITLMLLGCMLALCIYAMYLPEHKHKLDKMRQQMIDETDRVKQPYIDNKSETGTEIKVLPPWIPISREKYPNRRRTVGHPHEDSYDSVGVYVTVVDASGERRVVESTFKKRGMWDKEWSSVKSGYEIVVAWCYKNETVPHPYIEDENNGIYMEKI